MNIECSGLILYYTLSISIKKHIFCQIVIDALYDYNRPNALSYDALRDALLNITHQP